MGDFSNSDKEKYEFHNVDNDFLVNILNNQDESVGNFLDLEQNNAAMNRIYSNNNLFQFGQQIQQQQNQLQNQQQNNQNNNQFQQDTQNQNQFNQGQEHANAQYKQDQYNMKDQKQYQQKNMQEQIRHDYNNTVNRGEEYLFQNQQKMQQNQFVQQTRFNNNFSNMYENGYQQSLISQQQKQLNQKKRPNISQDKKDNRQLIISESLSQQEGKILEQNKQLFTYKNNLKNTYINKINSLITEKVQDEKPLQLQQQQNQTMNPFKLEEDAYQNEHIQFNSQNNKLKKFSVNINGSSDDDYDEDIKNRSGIQKISSNPNQYSQNTIQNSNFTIKADEMEKLNQKLARNRESARNSRKRKKVYIELLESKVQNLTDELEKTRKMLDQSKEYMNKINSHNQILTGFVFGRQQLFEKLDNSIKQNKDENEISLLLDSLRFRLGATGKERVVAINHFFKQMLDICIPTHFRYLLWTASESHDMFCENLEDKLNHLEGKSTANPQKISWRHELMAQLNLSAKQKSQLKRFQKKFMNEKVQMDGLIGQLQSMKDQIHTKSLGVQNLIDDIRTVLTPLQAATFLIFLEKNKYRREISNSHIWDAIKKNIDFEEEDEDEQEDDEEFEENQQRINQKNSLQIEQKQEEIQQNLNDDSDYLKKKICNDMNKN